MSPHYDYEGALEDIFDGEAVKITIRINVHGNYRLSVYGDEDQLLAAVNARSLSEALEALAGSL